MTSNVSKTIAIVTIGYQQFAVPLEKLADVALLFGFRTVERRYDKDYVYWYSGQQYRAEIALVQESDIHESEPPKASDPPKATVAAAKIDDRVIAAPSDTPIEIKSVPPMREFVDEFRHEDAS